MRKTDGAKSKATNGEKERGQEQKGVRTDRYEWINRWHKVYVHRFGDGGDGGSGRGVRGYRMQERRNRD